MSHAPASSRSAHRRGAALGAPRGHPGRRPRRSRPLAGVPVASVQGTLALDLDAPPGPAGRAAAGARRPAPARRHPDRPAPAPRGRAVGPALRPGRGRDRRRRPPGLPAAALVDADGLRRPRPPRPARRPGRRPPARPGPGAAGATGVVGVRTCFVHPRHGRGQRAPALRRPLPRPGRTLRAPRRTLAVQRPGLCLAPTGHFKALPRGRAGT